MSSDRILITMSYYGYQILNNSKKVKIISDREAQRRLLKIEICDYSFTTALFYYSMIVDRKLVFNIFVFFYIFIRNLYNFDTTKIKHIYYIKCTVCAF